MEIDPVETANAATESSVARDRETARLGTWVAITVALLATFLGVCKVKDDNIVQAMQQAQADKIDHWGYYQARNIREEIAKATLTTLRLQAADRSQDRQAPYLDAIAQYEKLAKEQAAKKEELKAQAEKDQQTYDALNFRDDQFDLSDALIAIAISLLALASLTQLWWLYAIAMVPAGSGVLMGLAGLAGWGIHPGTLISWLS